MKILKSFLVLIMVFAISGGVVSAEVAKTSEEVVENTSVETVAESPSIVQVKAKVVKIDTAYKEISGTELTHGGVVEGSYEEQYIKVEILSGEDEGKVLTVKNDLYGNPFDIKVKEGDKIFLYGQVGEVTEYSIRDKWHADGLILWTLIFFGLVLLIGGRAGVKALVSLLCSVFIIFFVFLPLVKNGYSPVPVTVAISAAIIFITHLIITGVGKKSWAAMLGTLGGVIVAVLMAYLISWSTGLSGLGTEEARTLAVQYPDYDFRGLLFSGIILGALGAVMDVGISIASGLSEVKEHSPNISRAKLIKSGFNIGRDIMGSMINTLIFAYIGSALVAIVLFSILQTSFIELINYDFIAEEIARSLVGSLGLLATIPLTAVLAGLFMAKK